ncbi:hypothetical protein [Thiomicrorhabdus sp. Kp2]|uniref:hypothetical protein n=1 Tax=Thiomicrorhabdus sp. Kp2 TaxID=1123518 RepID=UPI000429DDD5|nr:hypothetical protein [Thiomicrorhabdus sp. Kp2]
MRESDGYICPKCKNKLSWISSPICPNDTLLLCEECGFEECKAEMELNLKPIPEEDDFSPGM